MSKEKYLGRKYSVLEYDQNWITRFEAEAANLRKVLKGGLISIEHIGSTSVPGLAGKPTIDILAVIEAIGKTDQFVSKLESIGYKDLGQYVMEGSRLFVKEEDNTRLVNLHLYSQGHPHIGEMLGLRDYLRSHPEVVEEYTNLKRGLVEKYPDDYGSYRVYKDEWMNALKKKIDIN